MTVTGNPGISSAVISSYGDFGDLYEQYYSSALGANNTLTVNVTPDGAFSLLDQNGQVIEQGEVDKSNGTINVKGMEFTLGDANYVGTISVELDPPNTDNMLNVLTDIVNKINDPTLSNTEKQQLLLKFKSQLVLQ